MSNIDYLSLFNLVLPNRLLEFFTIIDFSLDSTRVDIYLEEKTYTPSASEGSHIISHGFTKECIIQDFPFRDKSLYLHIKRRRYINKQTGTTLCRDLSLSFEGTHLTAEFAAFLKGIHRDAQ